MGGLCEERARKSFGPAEGVDGLLLPNPVLQLPCVFARGAPLKRAVGRSSRVMSHVTSWRGYLWAREGAVEECG